MLSVSKVSIFRVFVSKISTLYFGGLRRPPVILRFHLPRLAQKDRAAAARPDYRQRYAERLGRTRFRCSSSYAQHPRLHIGSRRVQTVRFGAYLTYLLPGKGLEHHSALRAGTYTQFRLIAPPLEKQTEAMVRYSIVMVYLSFNMTYAVCFCKCVSP